MDDFAGRGIEIRTGATGNTKTICPKCHHKSKSLSVHIEMGVWRCWYCGHVGSLRGKANGGFPYSYGRLTKTVHYQPEGRKHASWTNGAGKCGLKGEKPGLYQLAEVEAAIAMGGAVFLVEGEKDSDALRAFGLTATTNPNGSGEQWRIIDTPLAKAHELVILYDNDPPGFKRRDRLVKQCMDIGIPHRVLDLPGVADGGDVTDWLKHHSFDELMELWERAPLTDALTGQSLADIAAKDLPDPTFFVEGILPEGATLLAGKPKAGKSVFVLQLAIAAAIGGVVAGKWQAMLCHVLYLALEDNDRRMKTRANALSRRSVPRNIDVHYRWPRIDEGGIERLNAYLARRQKTKIVIVDVLQKFRAVDGGQRNAYQRDYEAIEGLQQVAAKHSVAVLIVHHQRKAAGDDSVFDTMSGTLGLNGAADTLAILERKRMGDGWESTLHVTGRDLEEDVEVAMERSHPHGWTCKGDAADFKLGKERRLVIDYLKAHGTAAGLTVSEISNGLKKGFAATKKLCQRLAGNGDIEGLAQGAHKATRYRIRVG